MPSVSRAQHNYFEGVEHGDIPASPSTKKAAKDYVRADTGRNLKSLPKHRRKVKVSLKRRKAL